MSATTTTNGKPQRKQLADQLDRLDGIIDALAEGLNQAVIEACREGTRLAVKDAIVEIMTNPELRAMLAPPALPAATPAVASAPPVYDLPPDEPKPGLWARIKATAAAARAAVTGAATKAKETVTAKYKTASDTVVALGEATGESLPVRRMLWVGLGTGLVVGVICLVMPHAAAAVVGAVGVAVTSVAVQVGRWLKRAAHRFGLVS